MLVRGVVHHEVGDDADAAVARGSDELDPVTERPHVRIHGVEVDDVVPVVAVGGLVERHEPDAANAEAAEVVDALGEPSEVAAAVTVQVVEGLDVQAVEDRVLPPQVACGLDAHRRPGRTCSPKASMNGSRSWPTWCSANSSKPRPASSRSHSRWRPRSDDTRTLARTSSGVTSRARRSNSSTVSTSQQTGGSKTFVRHWSCAICSAFSSLGAHDRW